MWEMVIYSIYKLKASSGDFERRVQNAKRRTTPLSAYADISPERGDELTIL